MVLCANEWYFAIPSPAFTGIKIWNTNFGWLAKRSYKTWVISSIYVFVLVEWRVGIFTEFGMRKRH